jgi:phosphonate transport system ATP-binding protein
LDNTDITAAPPAELRNIRRKIGMVFQQFNLVKRSSVITNVLSGRLGYVNPWLSLTGFWPEDEKQRALKSLERVGIADKAYNRADALSGGQQQRVGIARALMQDPKLILADEPVASLDPVLSHSILQYLEQLNKEGITVICSLHFLDLVHRYATRVVALKDGIKVFEGSAQEIDRAKFKEIYREEAQEVRAASRRLDMADQQRPTSAWHERAFIRIASRFGTIRSRPALSWCVHPARVFGDACHGLLVCQPHLVCLAHCDLAVEYLGRHEPACAFDLVTGVLRFDRRL